MTVMMLPPGPCFRYGVRDDHHDEGVDGYDDLEDDVDFLMVTAEAFATVLRSFRLSKPDSLNPSQACGLYGGIEAISPLRQPAPQSARWVQWFRFVFHVELRALSSCLFRVSLCFLGFGAFCTSSAKVQGLGSGCGAESLVPNVAAGVAVM